MEQPSTESAGSRKCHGVFFVSFVPLIPNVIEKLEIVLTFCGIKEAVLGPYLYKGTLSF